MSSFVYVFDFSNNHGIPTGEDNILFVFISLVRGTEEILNNDLMNE